MKERMPVQLFSVGDTVRLRAEPYRDCEFGWNPNMGNYCGKVATVTNVEWYEHSNAFGYFLDIDDEEFVWCEDCFVNSEGKDIEESDASLDVLFGGVAV